MPSRRDGKLISNGNRWRSLESRIVNTLSLRSIMVSDLEEMSVSPPGTKAVPVGSPPQPHYATFVTKGMITLGVGVALGKLEVQGS